MLVSLWCILTIGLTGIWGVIYLIGVEFGVARFDIDGHISGRPRVVKRVTDGLHVLYLYALGFLFEFRCRSSVVQIHSADDICFHR